MSLMSCTVVILAAWLVSAAGTQATSRPATAPRAALSDGSSFVAVMIDDATEAVLGPFPYDRSIYATGVRKLDELGASVVVLKMYLDEPRSRSGDLDLAAALREAKAKVVLLAAPDESGLMMKPPARLAVSGVDVTQVSRLWKESRGWFPLPMFSEHADMIGFDAIRQLDQAPLLLNIDGKAYRSGFLAILETATGRTVEISPGKTVRLGRRSVALTPDGELPLEMPAPLTMDYIPFVEVLNGSAPTERLRGKVIVLGYCGSRAPVVQTQAGEVKSIVGYWQMLLAAERALAEWQQ